MAMPTKGAGGSASAAVGQILFDTFTGANGTKLDARSPDVGPDWSFLVGDFDIQDNHAASDTLPGGYCHAQVVLPRKTKEIFSFWRNVNDFADMRISFRILNDANYFYVNYDTNGNTIKLYRRLVSSSVELDTAAVAIANVTWYCAWVVITGNLIEVYHKAFEAYPATKPGSPILSASDSNLQSSKGAGIYGANAGQWWDNFEVTG